jgi:hypothetical protein
MKINEFVGNENLKKIEELIYFDEVWMFPEYNLNEYLGLSDIEFNKMMDYSKLVIDKFNQLKIKPEDYTSELFYKALGLDI